MRRGEQVVRAHQMILEKRKLAFVEFAEAGEQPLAHEPAEDRIPEELKAFIIGARSLRRGSRKGFVGARTMRDRPGEKMAVGEAIAKGQFEFVEIRLQAFYFPLDCWARALSLLAKALY